MTHSVITRAAMQSLENHFWKSRISIATKLKLNNTRIPPIFLYGTECWAATKVDWTHTGLMLLISAAREENTAWNQMVLICLQRGNEKDNQATEPYSDTPVTASFLIWAHCTLWITMQMPR